MSHNSDPSYSDDSNRHFECTPAGCKCLLCPRCARRNSKRVQKSFQKWLSEFKNLSIVTFTLKQSIFNSGQQAFELLRDKRCLRLALDFARKNKTKWFYVIEFSNGFPHVHAFIDEELSKLDLNKIKSRWNSFAKCLNSDIFGNIHPQSGNLSAPSRYRLANYFSKGFQNPAERMPRYLLDYKARSLRLFMASRTMTPSTKHRKAKRLNNSSAATPAMQPRPTIGQNLALCGSKTLISRVETHNGHTLRFSEQVLNVPISKVHEHLQLDSTSDIIQLDEYQRLKLLDLIPAGNTSTNPITTPNLSQRLANFEPAVEFIRIAAIGRPNDRGIAVILENAERTLQLLVEEANRHPPAPSFGPSGQQ